MEHFQSIVEYLRENDVDIFENCTVPEPLDIEEVKSNIMLRCGLLTPVYSEPMTLKAIIKMWFFSNQWTFEHLVNILLAEYSPIENVYEQDHWTEGHTGTDKRKYGGKDTFDYGEKHTLSGTDTFTHGEKHTLSGTDTLTHGETHTLSGKDTIADTGTNEHQVSAYNSGTYQADSKDTKSGGPETTYGKKDTASGDDKTQYGKTDTASGDDKTKYGKTDTASGTDTTNFGKTDDLTHGETIEYTRLRHGNIGVTTNFQLIEGELELLKKFNVYDWIASKFERENMLQYY